MNQPTNTTRRRLLLGLGVAATASIAGCGAANDDDDTTTTTGNDPETPTPTATPTEIDGMVTLRVAHLSANTPNGDVYVDGTAVLEDVPFGAVSNYLSVPAGAHQVTITAAGDADAVVFDEELTVSADTSYTAAAVGELGDMPERPFEVLVLEDDTTLPEDGTAKLRLVHVSPDAPAVDVTVESTGDVLYDGVAFGESEYVTVPEGAYTVQVRGDSESNDGDVVTSFDLDLAGGTVYTAFAGGYLDPVDGSAENAFDLFVAVDA